MKSLKELRIENSSTNITVQCHLLDPSPAGVETLKLHRVQFFHSQPNYVCMHHHRVRGSEVYEHWWPSLVLVRIANNGAAIKAQSLIVNSPKGGLR